VTSEIDLRDIQGNILHSYGLGRAVHFLVRADAKAAALELLRRTVPEVTPGRSRRPDPAVNLAVTYAGFRRLGLPGALLESFPEAFRQGPRKRARLLGDIGSSGPANWDEPLASNGKVHFVVTVHASSKRYTDEHRHWQSLLTELPGVEILSEQETKALPKAVEHFGYADGASQPVIEGVAPPARDAVRGGGTPAPGSRWRPLKAGEFILGHPDEDGTVDERPDADLVRNGSYVVYRKLQQKVAAFRERLELASTESGLSVEHVAAKIVGRWRDGVPIELDPQREPDELSGEAVDHPANDFRYLPHDLEGYACPRGAHIRRTNPRDAIEFGTAVKDTGRLSSRHRIIRRGMPYGDWLEPREEDDGTDKRGLLFICYNADIERQFELIQRAWCCDGDAFHLGEDQDFLLGNAQASPKMTIPMRGEAPRFIRTQQDLVVTRGTEYLFAPGLDALRRLGRGEFG
jgi:Dyp-type peroxidase family